MISILCSENTKGETENLLFTYESFTLQIYVEEITPLGAFNRGVNITYRDIILSKSLNL
jgi:hypothetical protein